jgi:acetyl-CoA carboxylase carboxyl transferase subunit beta
MDIQKDFNFKSQLEKIIDADELCNLFVEVRRWFSIFRIRSTRYFQILFDNNEFVELDKKHDV